MRCILIGIVLIINVVALTGIVQHPELFGPKISIFGIENSIQTELSLFRQRRASLYASRQLRYNPFTKKPKPHKSHKHRHQKFSFILRCPKIPKNFDAKKLGVEWSLNSLAILRIISDGRKFGSMKLAEYEQWRGINGKLNVLAYGPQKRHKFEFEEARGWFSMKIRNLEASDIGEWKCLIKLKYKNGTIFEFESRKKAVLQNSVTNGTNDAITYSDAPLFSFSKNDGEIAVFSRVDRSRDLLSYVRSLDDNELTKTIFVEPKQRSSNRNGSTSATLLPYSLIIFFTYWMRMNTID